MDYTIIKASTFEDNRVIDLSKTGNLYRETIGLREDNESEYKFEKRIFDDLNVAVAKFGQLAKIYALGLFNFESLVKILNDTQDASVKVALINWGIEF